MMTRSVALCCCLVLSVGCTPRVVDGGKRPPPSPDLVFSRVFPTTGSVVPRNLRIWYQPPESEWVGPFDDDYTKGYLEPPDFQKVIYHDEIGHYVELGPLSWHPVVELIPKPVFGMYLGRMLYEVGQQVVVTAGDEVLAEYTISDFVDDDPPSPPQVTLSERTTVDGQPAARFTVTHDPMTLVVAMRHPHPAPDQSSIFGVTETDTLLLSNHAEWVGTAVFDFFSVDVAGNWSTGVRVEVPDFGDASPGSPGPGPFDLQVLGPLMAPREQGVVLTVEGIRKSPRMTPHEALTAVEASASAPCAVATISRPLGWFDLLVTSPVAARCTVTIHGAAGDESAVQTAEVELRSAGQLVRRERESPCPDRAPATWHLPNGAHVCRSADVPETTWRLPDGKLKTVEGTAWTLLDPTHLLVCTDQRCAAMDEMGEVTSSVEPTSVVGLGVYQMNPGLTPADTLPRVLTGMVGLSSPTIDRLRWDGQHLTTDTKPNLFGPPAFDAPLVTWGNDWAVAIDVLVVPDDGMVVVYSTDTGESLWMAKAWYYKPYPDGSPDPQVGVVAPWLRFNEQLYSAPGVALADRLPPGIRFHSISGCFIGGDTLSDRRSGVWSPLPYHALWWFDVCATPMRQVMINVSEQYERLRVDADGLWARTLSGRWDFFGVAP